MTTKKSTGKPAAKKPASSGRRPALGKGLSALIGGGAAATTTASARPRPMSSPVASAKETVAGDAARKVNGKDAGPLTAPIDRIVPNRHQARTAFDEASLDALASSIKQAGIIQPLAVRPHPERDGDFELIAGERRFRAARRAGLTHVPITLIQADEMASSVLSLVENLQRENLNPIDEAEGLQSLIDQFQLTQEQIAQKIGRSRSAVANAVRLLSLPEMVKSALAAGEVSAGHGRALLALGDPHAILAAYTEVVQKGLSVRQTEAMVAEALERTKALPAGAKRPGASPSPATPKDVHVQAILTEIAERFGTKVEIAGKTEKGKVEIHYFSREDRDRILELLAELP
ncbi:MAG: ParB/RepB/Spo0J family partition protein [Deltaproteobacteria bacterium]|nr:ParB/RepB/Spo0J family partition protein [Deltaproteobacteria bacterium]MCB9487726.1 ParB/RepB/Spo0J family partition protein [Deltaproteobacteria bacterium]